MKLTKYIKSRGLTTRLVAQKLKMTRQALEQYGNKYKPRVNTMEKVADAMTELGAPTTVVDIVAALCEEEPDEENKRRLV